MKTVKKINSSNQLLSISNDAYKYKSENMYHEEKLFLLDPNRWTAQGNYELTETQWEVPETGLWLLSFSSAFNGNPYISNLVCYINGTIQYYPSQMSGGNTGYGTFVTQKMLTKGQRVSAGVQVNAANTQGGGIVFNKVLLQKTVPDVYAEKFATMAPDYAMATANTQVTGSWTPTVTDYSSNTVLTITAPYDGYAILNGSTGMVPATTPPNVGMIVYINNIVIDSILEHGSRNTPGGWTYQSGQRLVKVSAGDTIRISVTSQNNATVIQWGAGYRWVPSKQLQVVKPTVLALPARIKFLGETQVGFIETSAGVFKPEYTKVYKGTFSVGDVGQTWILESGFSPAKMYTGEYVMKCGFERFDGSSFGGTHPLPMVYTESVNAHSVYVLSSSFVLVHTDGTLRFVTNHHSSTVANIPYAITVHYYKTSDPTYTLADIETMEPQA